MLNFLNPPKWMSDEDGLFYSDDGFIANGKGNKGGKTDKRRIKAQW